MALLPDLDQMVFVVLAVTIVASSLKVVLAQEVMHAVIFLSIALLSVAGIYLTLGMEVLAMIQVLVYVGAVVTLILFTVMLTTPSHDIATPLPSEEEL